VPGSNEIGAAYPIAKGDVLKCKEIGESAVKPLLIELSCVYDKIHGALGVLIAN